MEYLSSSIEAISATAGKVLESRALTLYAKLTEQERRKFSDNGKAPVRLAKSLICAVDGGELILCQLGSEVTLKDIKALKRINKHRQY